MEPDADAAQGQPERQPDPAVAAARRAIEAVWRMEAAKVVSALVRLVRDLGLAEDLAQDALVAALESWPPNRRAGQPRRLADDRGQAPRARLPAPPAHRRATRRERLGHELDLRHEVASEARPMQIDAALDDDVGDNLLRLIFTACHPVLSPEARVRADPAPDRRPDHATRSPAPSCDAGADHRPAHRARQAHAGRGAGAVRDAARAENSRERLGVGAGGHLPDLQRRLFGHRRRRLDAPGAVRGGAAARPHAGRADAAASAKSTACVALHGDPGLAHRRAPCAGRRADPAARPGPPPLGPPAHPPRPRRAGAGRAARRTPSAPTRCRPPSPPATRARADGRGDRLGAHRRLSTTRSPTARALARRRDSIVPWPSPWPSGPPPDWRSSTTRAEPGLQHYHLLPGVRGDLLLKLGRTGRGARGIRARRSADAQRAGAGLAVGSGGRPRRRIAVIVEGPARPLRHRMKPSHRTAPLDRLAISQKVAYGLGALVASASSRTTLG